VNRQPRSENRRRNEHAGTEIGGEFSSPAPPGPSGRPYGRKPRGRLRRILIAICGLLAAGAAVWTCASGNWSVGQAAPGRPHLGPCLFGFCFYGPRTTSAAWPPSTWSFAVCDIGQGDALLLHVGPATAVALDTGPDPGREDACLRRFQITKLPLVVLTHFHADHIGGLSGLLRGRQVDEIETTDTDTPPYGAREVRAEAAAARIPVHRVVPGERRHYGPISWHVLWPDGSAFPPDSGPDDAIMDRMPGMGPSSGGADGSGPNNTSIVMAVTVAGPRGGLHILLTGDIESPVQQALLDGPARGELRADVLKVPHHGSANQAPGFINAVDPVVTVISVGQGNPYHQPAPKALRLMSSDGARLYRTDLDGDVAIGLAAGNETRSASDGSAGDGSADSRSAGGSSADGPGVAITVSGQHGDGADSAGIEASASADSQSSSGGYSHSRSHGQWGHGDYGSHGRSHGRRENDGSEDGYDNNSYPSAPS
jgi:beta-lactamase superfamily II metal-dependent hydrolase